MTNSSFKPRDGDTIINWGRSNYGPLSSFDLDGVNVINRPEDVLKACDKLLFFQHISDVNRNLIPQFWTSKEEIPDDPELYPIVCRTILSGHSGAGIVIADSRDDLVDAPLYVRYVKKKDEYRIHVGMSNGEPSVISVQRKARRLSTPSEEVNWQVRNLSGGFVFVREGVTPPNIVVEVGCDSLRATGLDFGAVDVIYNEYEEKAYVLEINTAPGLEGQTVRDYADFFRG